MAQKDQQGGKRQFLEIRIRTRIISLTKMSISWIAPTAQVSSDAILTPYTVGDSAVFDGLVDNGERCCCGISPLSIYCLLEFPNIHQRKTDTHEKIFIHSQHRHLFVPKVTLLLCSLGLQTMRNNVMCQTNNYFLEASHNK